MERCHNCQKKILPCDEDAGTYKEYFCSKACEIEAEKAMQEFEKKTKLKSTINNEYEEDSLPW